MDEQQQAQGVSSQSEPHHIASMTTPRYREAAESMTDNVPTEVSDIHEETSDSVGQRRTDAVEVTDSVGQEERVADKGVGHDVDLPPKDDRHTLSTYEAGKMFEEAQCRVSERTIIDGAT